jgi:putative PIG3 family NAD(P)H quinone oxidoreductase
LNAIMVIGERDEPVLKWTQVPDIDCGPDEVLVDVWAAGVNRADLSQARGHYPPPPGASEVLGLEAAGTIVKVGSNVSGWQAGDRVCSLLAGGGYAERVAVPAGMLLRLPEHWSFVQGAAVPEAWYTAYINLFEEGRLRPGETILIHAGASGVGTAAIQLATDSDARAIVTVGTDEKARLCMALGAVAINYKTQDFLAATLEATDGQGVDVILDPVGGSYLARNTSALRPFGRLVNIGLLGGSMGELNMENVLRRRLHLIGSTLRSRSWEEKIAITRRFEKSVLPKLADGRLRPIIDRTYSIAQAQAAHRHLAENRTVGKVVLEVPG